MRILRLFIFAIFSLFSFHCLAQSQVVDLSPTATTPPMSVYIPSPTAPENGWPTLYLLHGIRGNHRAWVEEGNIQYVMDSLIASHLIEPMLVVMPYCFTKTDEDDINHIFSRYHNLVSGQFEQAFSALITFIEQTYHASSSPDHRYIGGLSSGARQALNLSKTIPFRIVGLFSSVLDKDDYPTKSQLLSLYTTTATTHTSTNVPLTTSRATHASTNTNTNTNTNAATLSTPISHTNHSPHTNHISHTTTDTTPSSTPTPSSEHNSSNLSTPYDQANEKNIHNDQETVQDIATYQYSVIDINPNLDTNTNPNLHTKPNLDTNTKPNLHTDPNLDTPLSQSLPILSAPHLLYTPSTLSLPYYWLATGNRDFFRRESRSLATHLSQEHIPYQMHYIHGKHNWDVWREVLPQFLLFISTH